MMRRTLLLVTLALASACGGGSLSVADYYSGLVTAVPAFAVCDLGVAPEYARIGVGFTQAQIDFGVAQVNKAIAAGRAKFDGAKAQACLDSLHVDQSRCWGPSVTRASLPQVFGDAFKDCNGVVVGTVADNGVCYGSNDCVSGQCSTTNATCPGACVPAADTGGDCSQKSCKPGLRCQTNGSSETCVVPGLAGGSCNNVADCGSGLSCVNQKCATPLAANASCDPTASDPCAEGLWCSPSGSDASKGACLAQVDANGACTGPDASARASASAWPQCKGNQICVGTVRQNGSVTTMGHCDVPHDVGGACVGTDTNFLGNGCYLGLVCSSGKCALLPGVGAACPSRVCDPNVAVCTNGTCVALKADGAACGDDTECTSTRCDSSSHCAEPTQNACLEP